MVRTWFEKQGGGTLLLPDGWFGRPHDNIHTLASIQEKDRLLIVLLDEGRNELKFEKIESVKVVGRNLVFSNFAKCSFTSKAVGDPEKITVYEAGSVSIVAH